MGEFDKIIVLSNTNEWNFWCWQSALSTYPIDFYFYGLPLKSELLYKLCRTHYSRDIPFKWIWHPFYRRNLKLCRYKNPLVIIYDWSLMPKDLQFVNYLKRHAKVVYVFTNIVKITGATTFGLLDKLNNTFDAVYAFDKIDAIKYGFKYNALIYNMLNVESNEDRYKSDVFYLGRAKGQERLDTLHQLFEMLTLAGYKCKFNIVDVEDDKMKFPEGITYNKGMTYAEALKYIKGTNCLIDVIQQDSTGLTIKTCESIIFDKKLITTNHNVQSEPFYDKNNVLIFEHQDIDDLKSFLDKPFNPYSEDEKYSFSVKKFLATLQRDLK